MILLLMIILTWSRVTLVKNKKEYPSCPFALQLLHSIISLSYGALISFSWKTTFFPLADSDGHLLKFSQGCGGSSCWRELLEMLPKKNVFPSPLFIFLWWLELHSHLVVAKNLVQRKVKQKKWRLLGHWRHSDASMQGQGFISVKIMHTLFKPLYFC